MLAEFETLLKATMGLDAESIGVSSIERAVQQRMNASHKESQAEYLEHVRGSEKELQELIEAVVVPETWFFRDPEAFAALAKLALHEWLPAHPEGRMRVLSAPSSTGEEPYSMAMTLLDAGFPASRFHIDAIDISTRSLTLARRAIYGRNSFRSRDLGFRDRYFEPVTHGHHLGEAVRRCVQFHHANLFDPQFLAGHARYDFIFCRNVLIYFDRPMQDQALRKLDQLLAPKGLMFVGPAETGLLVDHQYTSAKLPLAFAFRRAEAVKSEPKPAPKPAKFLPPPPPAVLAPIAPLAAPKAPKAAPKHAHAAPAPAAAKPKPTVADAEKLADAGKLDEAAACCEELLRAQGPSAPVLYLVGLVRDAQKRQPEAIDAYRKALYLDPHHEASLMNLAYLLEQQGDAASARVLRGRARRAHDKKPA